MIAQRSVLRVTVQYSFGGLDGLQRAAYAVLALLSENGEASRKKWFILKDATTDIL
jgi:hypothetical protein